MPRPVAILFDLDDTLIDRRATARAYAAVFRRDFGPRLRDPDVEALTAALIRADGGGYRAKTDGCRELRAQLPWRDAPAASALLEHWREHFPACSQWREQAPETLSTLQGRGHPLGLVTNGSTEGQSRKVDLLGLRRFFGCVVISETVGWKKPDPRIFHHAAAQLGEAPAACWFVGDHPVNDVLGAAGAGLTPVWLRGMQPWPAGAAAPRYPIDRLGELAALVA